MTRGSEPHSGAPKLHTWVHPLGGSAHPYEAQRRPIVTITNVHVDENVLINLPRFGDTEVRQPDFIDFEFQTAVWIGEDASVEVPLSTCWRVAEFARQQGSFALRGLTPEGYGITVVTYAEGYVHPAFSAHQDAAKAKVNTLWRE